MRILFVMLAAALSTALFAQDISRSIGIQLLPGVSSRRFLPNNVLSSQEIRDIEDREMASFSYGAGVNYLVRGEKAGFSLGLLYQQLGYETNRFEWTESESFEEAEETFVQQALSLPAAINFYQELGRTDRFYFLLGLELSYQLSTEETRTLFDRNSSFTEPIQRPEEEEFRRTNFALRTGMGWEHDFSPRLMLSLQPTFQYWFRSLLRDTDGSDRNLYSLGVRAALNFGW